VIQAGTRDRQVKAVCTLLKSPNWDSIRPSERIRIMLRAQDLGIDSVKERALAWGVTQLEARIRLTWWLRRVHYKLSMRLDARKAS